MTFLTVLPLLMLAASTTAGPIALNNDLVVTRNFFLNSSIKYTAHHDIVSLVVPLNKLNFDDDKDDHDSNEESDDVTFFFVEADINDKGVRQYEGLYVYSNEKATKVLENGRDATAFNDDSKIVYLGASDGIYIYNGADGKTEKYGTISDDVIQIEADNQTGIIYYLTEDHQLYSIADEGTTRNKVETVKDAQEIVIDYTSNIFYYDSNKQLYVLNQDGLKKFENLPKFNEIKLVRPMFAQDEGIFGVVDNTLYLLHFNGTAEESRVTLEVKPTAYAIDATLIQYYAFEKKIYEFNVIELGLGSELAKLKEFLEEKKNDIEYIATKSRSAFGE